MDNEELTLFRDMARRALEQEISPHIEEWDWYPGFSTLSSNPFQGI